MNGNKEREGEQLVRIVRATFPLTEMGLWEIGLGQFKYSTRRLHIKSSFQKSIFHAFINHYHRLVYYPTKLDFRLATFNAILASSFFSYLNGLKSEKEKMFYLF